MLLAGYLPPYDLTRSSQWMHTYSWDFFSLVSSSLETLQQTRWDLSMLKLLYNTYPSPSCILMMYLSPLPVLKSCEDSVCSSDYGLVPSWVRAHGLIGTISSLSLNSLPFKGWVLETLGEDRKRGKAFSGPRIPTLPLKRLGAIRNWRSKTTYRFELWFLMRRFQIPIIWVLVALHWPPILGAVVEMWAHTSLLGFKIFVQNVTSMLTEMDFFKTPNMVKWTSDKNLARLFSSVL